MDRAVHFVGFRDDRYWAAVKVFGKPDIFHRRWDTRAAAEIAPGDTVVFATGTADDVPSFYAFNDSEVF